MCSIFALKHVPIGQRGIFPQLNKHQKEKRKLPCRLRQRRMLPL